MATWHATDGGRDPEAPVLLVPLTVRKSGRNGLSILERSGDAHINPVLLHALELEHSCRVDSERISQMMGQLDPVNGLTNNEEDDSVPPAFDPGPLYSYLGEIARAVEGFNIRHQLIVGNFAFQKMAMVKDLEQHTAELAAHDLIAAIAGDTEAREVVRARQYDIDPRMLDQISASQEFLILYADSSQERRLGENYHSSPTARDRDRLRHHLEALGWHFHHIWSTDRFFRREEGIQRVEVAYRAAVKAADARIDGGKEKPKINAGLLSDWRKIATEGLEVLRSASSVPKSVSADRIMRSSQKATSKMA